MHFNSTYDCYSPNLFQVWTRFFLLVLFAIILTIVMGMLVGYGVYWFFATLVFAFLYSGYQIFNTEVSISRYNDTMSFSGANQSIQCNALKSATQRWCYGFGNGSPEIFAAGGSGKSQARINTIHIVLILEFESEIVYLVEALYMSEKFPHGVEYDESLDLKAHPMFKVWNMQKCIQKLQLGTILK